ncbi:MAG: hypothetical protein MR291_05755 [Oscillospiraceae bacterium]|nr:hypothetical protein [Oscillospiraceae bacterium]
MVQNYEDFCAELLKSGFSLGGGSDKGIYAVVPFDWTQQPEGTAVRWHTGEPDTDPWEWRMRVLEERSDIAYAKVFFRGSGYITEEWYPYFLAARRKGMTFDEAWEAGLVSDIARRIYRAVEENGRVAMHEIKQLAGLSGESSAHIEKAMTDLQMGMFLTICGRQQKLDKFGQAYGWSSTVFCTVEEFWGKSFDIPEPEAAAEKIRSRVLQLDPAAQERKIKKFIFG